ncbi:MAG: 16S rRNA (uracil(1498)-N(3))-methyltransferase [Cellulomonadaceae bacterium]|jgi:16S rRNA (uracil1498-N3)-methyltransferase|nr:16S rRNA (uracil(1498)-N(3))-methyltransferase [Cellulomonadaceae bacterium]
MTAPVFLGESSPLAGLQAGDRYILGGDEGRHARVVQRRALGEAIDLVDGRGLRLRCVVSGLPTVEAQSRAATLELTVQERIVEAEPQPVLTLVQGLAKGEHSDLAITQAVETGVNAIVPWQADRSIVIWRGDREAKSLAKWSAAVTAAAKQSRRAFIPPISAAVNSVQLAKLVASVTNSGGLALVLDSAGEIALSRVELPSSGQVLVIVGPEGGISDTELAALSASGAISVRMGPEIMRSSTAGAVAIALLAVKLGRWEG